MGNKCLAAGYNECLQKLSLQDALLGLALFFYCPVERETISE
jgi:hypothetical protein